MTANSLYDSITTMKTSNKKARQLVATRAAFKGSNTFGQTHSNGVYAVYSYGVHFPMYAYIGGRWYGNQDKYSSSTSKHQGQLHPPYGEEIKWVSTQGLKDLIAK